MKRNQAREHLKELSAIIKMGFKSGMYEEYGNVNEVLLGPDFYNIEDLELDTFHGWLKKGYRVKKGSKGYIIWAKPKKMKKGDKPEQEQEQDKKEEEKGKNWFPTCYLFTSEQVEPIPQEVEA